MVQDEKAGPRHIVDNGSSTRGTGDRKRSADKSYQGLSSVRQAKSQVGHRAKRGLDRLNSAVLAQAAKDLCSAEQESVDKVLAWTNTPMFREICGIAGLEHEETAKKMRTIADMPLRIRHDLVHLVQKTNMSPRGGEFLNAAISKVGEAERKG